MKSRKTTGRKPRTTKTVSATSKRKPSAGRSGKKSAGEGSKVSRKPKKSKLEEEYALLVKEAGLPEPVREHRFHPTRRWRIDFAWLDHKVAVEVEGGIYMRGRHNRPVGMIADIEKYSELALAGWTLIRVAPPHIRSGQAIEWTTRALAPSLLQ